MTIPDTSLREWLAHTLAACCDGVISAARILDADCSFAALGVDSLALVRLLDAIESELGVTLEIGFPEDLDALTAHLSHARSVIHG